MKGIFAKIKFWLKESVVGRLIWKTVIFLKLDVFVYFLLDEIEPDWKKSDVESSREFFIEHRKDVQRVLNGLEDEYSKETYRNVVNYRMTGKKGFIVRIGRPIDEQYVLKDRYGKSMIHLEKESIVDCGAYTGDSIVNFMKNNISFKDYFAFEANKYNIEIGRNNYSNKGVTIFPYAVGNENGECIFEMEEGTESAVGKIGEKGIRVDIRRIDDILKGNKVTLIKMDIEGAEMVALQGAEETIKKQRPILAISIYHSDEDMIRIFDYINSIMYDVKFYCRHYGLSHSDTILYAIPCERL